MKSLRQLGSDWFMEPIMGLFDLSRAIPAGFCIDDAVEDGDAVVIVVRAQAAGGLCSLSGSPSAAVHSRYDRKLNDLPIGGRRVQLVARDRALHTLVAAFAKGLMKDKAAVAAAIASPWSNGQTEGQICKLKLVKRQMYGRGKIDLLQARVIGLA